MCSRAQFTSFMLGGLACAGWLFCGCQANVAPRPSTGAADASDSPDPVDPGIPSDPSLDDLRVTVLANAGPDQTVTTGAVVTLTGSATPAGGNTYAWTQLAGPAVTLSGANQAVATFTAPIVSGGSQALTFRLTVQHANQSGNDTMQVTVLTPPPAPTVVFSCTPLDGVRDLSVTCSAATVNGAALPAGTYAWTFDTQMESGPVTTHATRTHVFSTAGMHAVTLTLTLAGLTAPIGCLSSQTNTPNGQVLVWPRISGQITDSSSGAGVASVAVAANPGGYTGVSNSSGSYQIDVPYNWSGSVTPQSTAYNFTPTSRTLSAMTADQLAQNFAGASTIVGGAGSGGAGSPEGGGGTPPPPPAPPTTVTISGHVANLQGASVAGVTLSASGAGSTQTDASGNYTLTVSYQWSGTVTPAASAYYFTPPSLGFTSLASNQSGADFTAVAVSGPTIVGTVRHYDGTVWSGVPVVFAGTGASAGINFTVTTDSNGLYQQTVPTGWSGTATSDPNYRFEPASLAFTNQAAPLVGQNVTAFRNYYVATDGSDSQSVGGIATPFRTLYKAFQFVAPGATVFLRGGTHIGNDQEFARLWPTASGTPDEFITLRNYPGESPVVQSSPYGWTFIYFWKGNSYWRIQGFEAVGFQYAFNLDVASGFGPPHDFAFSNLTVHECGDYAVAGDDGKAFRIVNGVHHISVVNSDLYHCAGPGIFVREGCHDILVENVQSHDHDDGRGTDGDADGFTTDWSVPGSYPYNLTFRNCTVWNTSEDGIDCKGDDILIERCLVHNVGSMCFKIWSIWQTVQAHATIRNCVGYGASDGVCKLIMKPDVQLFNNTFIGHSLSEQAAVYLRADDPSFPNPGWVGHLVAKNNIFTMEGPLSGSQFSIVIYEDHWAVEMDYNVLHNVMFPNDALAIVGVNRPGGYVIYSNAQVTNGTLFANEGLEQHGTGSNPLFVNYTSNDFHLSSTDSIARNTGTALNGQGVVEDLEGAPRPQGPGYDRGGYERP